MAESPEFFPRHFHGFKPLVPGIVQIIPEWQGPFKAGIIRKVVLSDGSSVRERVTEHKPYELHRYEMAELNSIQRLVCQGMSAEFTFEQAGANTHVVWTYQIKSENILQYPLVALVGWAFGKAMARCMASIAQNK